MNDLSKKVPHLTTALTGPLQFLEKHLLAHQDGIEDWLLKAFEKTPAPFYASVDLRNAGFKLAPVDTNLFPAGFNNLNPEFMPLCVEAAKKAVEAFVPGAKKILLIPENHTRNQFYLASLEVIKNILMNAGFKVHVGMGDFDPDVILLNHDLSGGVPKEIEALEKPIMPPLNMGWVTRLKSSHFIYYEEVSKAFAQQFDVDPWLISPLFNNCGEVDFMKREGEDCLVRKTKALLSAVQLKYNAHGITETPFAVVKADAGTYGMAVMMVKDAEALRNLNRKQRTSMSTTKGGQVVTKAIVQEGVYTFETWGDKDSVAEPVVYMIGQQVVGGFYRVHTKKRPDENLNAPGMHFEPLAFAQDCQTATNRFYAYSVIARLALLAAARELKE